MKRLHLIILISIFSFTSAAQDRPLRLGIAGVTHDHIWEVVSKMERNDFCIVGVAEPNEEYRMKNALTGKVDTSLFYGDLEQMLDETRPEAVAAYGSIYEHLAVVKACAPRGIHVMVEKPLATSYEDAVQIRNLARRYGIKVMTNYETTWYNTNRHAKNMIDEGMIGDLFRINIYDGHRGPKEIGCADKFLEWLTDPVLNGGGAVIDFGCYGANIATWLLDGEEPLSVYAVLQQNKPETYPEVDDDATIIVKYPGITVQIMGSWCWPKDRKDMYVYGMDGYIYQKNSKEMESWIKGQHQPLFKAPENEAPFDDSFRMLKALVRDEVKLEPYDPNSLENNIITMKILDAARKSAATGKAVRF